MFRGKIFLFFGLVALCCPSINGESKTTFIPRLISTDTVFELALTNYSSDENKEHWRKNVAIKPFYQQSFAKKSLARFFLPHNKECSLVREDGFGDINPLWFNVIAASDAFYSSTLTIRPERIRAGAVFTWFSWFTDHLWFGVNSALICARHDLHLKESQRTSLGTLPGFPTMIKALNNPAWCAGKLPCKADSRVGLDDIQMKLGYDFLDDKDMHCSLYGVGTIPTGNQPKARYLFEPLVGSVHGSVGAGLNADVALNNSITFMTDVKYNYVFAHDERRTFDLCNGDWSRYLLVVFPDELLNTFPGINYFTKLVSIVPGNTFQAWMALHYETASWKMELGYNFWLRGREQLALKCSSLKLDNGSSLGIFDMNVCRTPITTAHTATISQSVSGSNLVVGDAEFTPTMVKDINLSSAKNRRAVSNTLYISTGYQFPENPLFVALNIAYEYASTIHALSNLSVWGILGVQF